MADVREHLSLRRDELAQHQMTPAEDGQGVEAD